MEYNDMKTKNLGLKAIEEIETNGVAYTNAYRYDFWECTDLGSIIAQRTNRRTKSVSYVMLQRGEYPENPTIDYRKSKYCKKGEEL